MNDWGSLLLNENPEIKTRYLSVEVGIGWKPLVERIITSAKANGIKLVQIKEKFGQLRVYTDTYNQEVSDVITQAEFESAKICETCGKPGELRYDISWVHCACDEHHIKE